MIRFDIKTLVVTEILFLVMIGLLSMDFLPRNYNEFQGICSQTWPKDRKQYEICMQPYYRQTNIDKYARIAVAGALVLFPLFYFFQRKQN